MQRAHELVVQRFLGIEDAPREAPLQRGLHAHQARQKPTRRRFGRDAAPRKDKAKTCFGAGQSDVHGQLHGHANAHGRAVDGADHGLEAFEDAQRDDAAAVAVNITHAVLVACRFAARRVVKGFTATRQISPRAKGLASAGDDDHTHGVIGIGFIEHSQQFVTHLRVEGIHFFRAIECDGGNAGVNAVEQGLQGGQGHRGVLGSESEMAKRKGCSQHSRVCSKHRQHAGFKSANSPCHTTLFARHFLWAVVWRVC